MLHIHPKHSGPPWADILVLSQTSLTLNPVVKDCICPPDSYVEVLTPSTLECDCIQRQSFFFFFFSIRHFYFLFKLFPFLFPFYFILEYGWLRWHHQLNGHEFEQTPGENEGQGSLESYNPWGRKESDATWQLNNSNDSRFTVLY